MNEKTPVLADRRFREAIKLVCTARQTRLHAERHSARVRASLEEVADDHSRTAMELVIGV